MDVDDPSRPGLDGRGAQQAHVARADDEVGRRRGNLRKQRRIEVVAAGEVPGAQGPRLDAGVARALEAGVTEHGASLHFVTADLDGGPVIAQARVPVLPGDDADALAARVLATEHPLMLAPLQLLCAGRITLQGATVALDGQPMETPLQLASNRLRA